SGTALSPATHRSAQRAPMRMSCHTCSELLDPGSREKKRFSPGRKERKGRQKEIPPLPFALFAPLRETLLLFLLAGCIAGVLTNLPPSCLETATVIPWTGIPSGWRADNG